MTGEVVGFVVCSCVCGSTRVRVELCVCVGIGVGDCFEGDCCVSCVGLCVVGVCVVEVGGVGLEFVWIVGEGAWVSVCVDVVLVSEDGGVWMV